MNQKFPIPLSQDMVEALLEKVAPGAFLQSWALFAGSFSNETSRLLIKTAVGAESSLVIRRYAVFGSYDRGEKASREFRTLQLLQQHNVPAPAPLLLDTNGELLGSPGIVTSYVPGRQVITPPHTAIWVNELAHTLARIHAIPLTSQETDYLLDANREVVWFLRGDKVTESMAAHPDGAVVWQAVHDELPQIQPTAPALVHVDYWLGNILWQDGRITAVLDWEEAASGDPGYDVAYLRVELAMLGGEALADQFLAAYVTASGHPVPNLAFWELAAAARFMPDPAGLITEWQVFGQGEWSAAKVRQNFSNFIYSSQRRGASANS